MMKKMGTGNLWNYESRWKIYLLKREWIFVIVILTQCHIYLQTQTHTNTYIPKSLNVKTN